MTDLLPCPFCGGKANIDCDDYGPRSSGNYFISCENAGCGDDIESWRIECPIYDALVAAWNPRAPPADTDGKPATSAAPTDTAQHEPEATALRARVRNLEEALMAVMELSVDRAIRERDTLTSAGGSDE